VICALALLLAVVLRIADPMAPAPRSDIERMLRRHVAVELADRSWHAAALREAREWALFDAVLAELRDPVLRQARAVHNRLAQPAWTGLVKPAKPYMVWPTYMGQPHRVPGLTLPRELTGVAA
jgi:hypothetical protein